MTAKKSNDWERFSSLLHLKVMQMQKVSLKILRYNNQCIMSVGVAPMQPTLEQPAVVIRGGTFIFILFFKKQMKKRKYTTYCSASLRLRQTPTWLGCGILCVTRKKNCWLASNQKHNSVYTHLLFVVLSYINIYFFPLLQHFLFCFFYNHLNKQVNKVSHLFARLDFCLRILCLQTITDASWICTSSVYVGILIKLAWKQSWLSTL